MIINKTIRTKEPITPRETQVLELVVQGFTNNEIAKELSISPKTVDSHRTNLMRKLNARKVTDLVWYAVRNKNVEALSKGLAPSIPDNSG